MGLLLEFRVRVKLMSRHFVRIIHCKVRVRTRAGLWGGWWWNGRIWVDFVRTLSTRRSASRGGR